MASDLSAKARRVLRGLLAGKSLNDLAPPGGPVHREVSEYLSAAAEERKPARPKRPARAAKRSGGLDDAVAYSDGASRGNPGPASYGIRILDADGEEAYSAGARIGKATNNVAEYRGAIAAVEAARDLGVRRLELRMDSELVVKQLRGEYRVKQPALAELKSELDRLIRGFDRFHVSHVRREENSETDRLANEALDAP